MAGNLLKIFVAFAVFSLLIVTNVGPEEKGLPPDECALLDDPNTRGQMSAMLEKRLLAQCGREGELGLGAAEALDESQTPMVLRTGESPAGSMDVPVNDPSGDAGGYSHTQSETSIAVNEDTGTICACYNDSYHAVVEDAGNSGFSSSGDGGIQFMDRGVHPAGPGGWSYGDPSVVWRKTDGLFYYAALCSAGLCLWQSVDDCTTFSQYSVIHYGWGDDKPFMALDNNPASPYYGRVYVAWSDFNRWKRICVTHSDLGWSMPLEVSDEGAEVQGAWPAVAPNGDVYVGWVRWSNYPEGTIDIEVVRSTNGGASFFQVSNPLTGAVNPRDAAATNSCWRPALKGGIRYLPSPQLAVGPDGVLHAAYSYDPDGYNRGDVIDVFYRRSTDNGVTWGPEIRLNDDDTKTDQWFPTISVGPGNKVFATWYDRRLDPSNNYLFDYYGCLSMDGGVTWGRNIRISDVSSPVYIDPSLATCYHGDYDQQVQQGDDVYILWSDDRNVQDRHHDPDIWFEKQRLTCDDGDGDGYGNPASPACAHPERDCNDSDPAVSPGAAEGPDGDETCSDTIDNDCDGQTDLADIGCIECVDNDSDGYGSPASGNCAYPSLDCNDADLDVNPGMEELCYNHVDDDCDGVIDAAVDSSIAAPATVTGNTCGAGHDCAGRPSEEIVYEVTIPSGGTWTFDLCDSSYDTHLSVGTVAGGNDVGQNDDGCGGFQSFLTVDLSPGTYYATVEGFANSDCGEFVLYIHRGGPGCFADYTMTAPGAVTGNTCEARNDCVTWPSEEVVYEVTIPSDGNWTFDLCNSSYDTYLVVGTKPGRDDVGRDDDGCDSYQSLLSADLTAGTYYVAVEGGYWGWNCGQYVLAVYPTPGEGDSLLAVTDNTVGPNSTVMSISLEIPGHVLAFEETVDYSGKAWVEFNEVTRVLWMPDVRGMTGTVDFSFSVLLWEITGTLKDAMSTKWYLYPTYVDPSDGSFTSTVQSEWRFVLSAYIAGLTIVEDMEMVFPLDPFEVSGTLIERGDTDGDGSNEYELALRGLASLAGPIGEIPFLGEATLTVEAMLDLGFVAETLSADGFEEDNFPEDGTLLSQGQVQRHIIYPDGDVDWIQVSALEGTPYEVKTFNLLGSVADTVLEVYDETESMIASNDDSDGWSHASTVTWTAGYTGTYYVKARTAGGSYGHFDDQGGGPAFCSYDIGFACSDLDGDGYGDPGSPLCTYPETDCDDSRAGVNPGAEEVCYNRIDDDCDGVPDDGCGYSAVANAQASLYGARSVAGSGIVNQLSLLVVPLAAVIVLRFRRRTRRASS